MPSSGKAAPGLSLPESRVGRAGILVLLTGVYVLAGKAGLVLAYVHPSASAVWPPTAIALAAFLLLGRGVWPAILVGAFLVNFTTFGTALTSAGIAVGNTLEGLIGAHLAKRFAGGARMFERASDIARFVVLTALLATTVSATIGVATLEAAGRAPWADAARIWFTWWLGDATAAVILFPVLVLAAVEGPPRWTASKLGEATALAVCIVAAGFVVFHGVLPQAKLVLSFPFPLWAAFRFGRRETAACVCVLSGFALWGTLLELGPFASPSTGESLLLLQGYMGALSVMMLSIAAVVADGRRVERELRTVRDELEGTVEARTESLLRAVLALEQEVSDRKRAEDDLRESEARVRGLLDAVPDAMIVVNAAGSIIEVSAQAERMFGYRRNELFGKPVEALVPAASRKAHEHHRLDFSGDPRARAMGEGLELHARRRDGTEFPVEISLSPVRIAEGVLVMAAVRDITERKQVEVRIRKLNVELERRVHERTAALERSNEALRQFAYAASHDLREPARTMRTYAELLERRYRGRLDPDADEFLGFIVDGADWMHQLLRGLLDYSRVEMREPWSAAVRMNAALDQALGNLGAAIAETGARITRDPLPEVVGNDLQVVQLLQNLVGNSIKFRRPATPPEVHVSVSERETQWIFAVKDNGIGIEPRHAERVFALFQRLHPRQDFPGAGMGLAICRKIVELHGGRIWVEPRSEGGATFLFSLPRGPLGTA